MATICVYCSASEDIAPGYLDLATEMGHEIGKRGHGLVSGGGRVSMMGAVATATREAGGRTVGVIPEALRLVEVGDELAAELIVTPGMRERKGIMDARADAFVALPGGLGTLEELLEVWVARTLGMHLKPVVVIDPDDIFAALREQVDVLVDRGFMRPTAREACVFVRTVAEAFDAIDVLWAAEPVLRSAPAVSEMLESEL